MSDAKGLYEEYQSKMTKIADVRNATGLLQWDQETYLPVKGAGFRGQQISTLTEMAHELFISPDLGILLKKLLQQNDLTEEQRRNIERTEEDYTKSKKYKPAFVKALSDQVNKAFHAWIEARKQNSFAVFEKELAGLVTLKKQETDLLGYEEHPYNALLDEFEKGATVALLDKTFSGLLPSLSELNRRIAAQPRVDDSFLKKSYNKDQQWQWGLYLIKQLHFDLEKGRQDLSEHPFSISFDPNDVRITTRISENDFANMTWSCIHEVGHALYEQGLPEAQYGLPLGEACSYSIHESQSRLWENNVGRSFEFWQHYFPKLQQHFPEQLNGVSVNDFYKGINKVQPSLIRTEADEITYHFHVFVRYELEKNLIAGSIATADIPAFWNEHYKKYLMVDVPDDKQGCLQDVHWSHGSFGYFPTYSLGSFYAAQFFAKASLELKNLKEDMAKGETKSLLNWLRQQVHAKGRFYQSEDLCRAVTGETLNVSFFIDYITEKYSKIYNLSL